MAKIDIFCAFTIVQAIHSLGLTWDVYEDDFFPYVSGPEVLLMKTEDSTVYHDAE